MAYVRCNTCGGEYREVQRDGTSYFHVCPPETIVRGRRDDGTEIEGPLDTFKDLILVQSRRERDELVNDGTPAESIIVVRDRRHERRAERRDENTARREGDRGERRVLRREGRGVTVLKTDAELAAEDADAL